THSVPRSVSVSLVTRWIGRDMSVSDLPTKPMLNQNDSSRPACHTSAAQIRFCASVSAPKSVCAILAIPSIGSGLENPALGRIRLGRDLVVGHHEDVRF